MSQSTFASRADRLIAGSQIAGTHVYDLRGERVGHIDDVMIDTSSGRIAYAVLSFGGFLGIGDTRHPLPWTSLRYDSDLDGYVVDLDRTLLETAPAYPIGSPPLWESIDVYYGSGLRADDDMPLNAGMPR